MGVIRSGGALAAISRPAAQAPYSTLLADQVTHTYGRIYRTQPQIRTVVSFLARNVGDLGIQTFRRVSDTDRQRVTDHPFARSLATPFPGVTPYRFKETLVSDLCIYDWWGAVKFRGDDGRVGLLRVPPEWATPLGGTWWAPAAYRIDGGRGNQVVDAADMVVLHGYNPENPRGGLPPMESLRQLLIEEFEAARYRQQMWRSGARISGTITRPSDAPAWSDTARERFRADWQAMYAAGGADAGGTPLLEDGMTFTPQSFTSEQSQYIESRKLTREEAAAAYHVPPPMVGILEHATFSNITEQHKNLYQDTLGPWLTLIVEEFMAQWLPEFGDTEDLYCEFNLQAKLRGSFEEQASQLQTAVGGPWLTRNEARARQNLSSIDGGDELIVPLNVIEGGQASPTDSVPAGASAAGARRAKLARIRRVKARADDEQAVRYENLLSDFFETQAAVVLNALTDGLSLTAAWGDPDRWQEELRQALFGANLATVRQAAERTLADLGLDPSLFEAALTEAWLLANASGVADGVNGQTLAELQDATASDDPAAAASAVFTVAAGVRAAQIAVSQVTSVSGFGTHEAVAQLEVPATKTWVTGSNPRSAHARLDGETVPLDETFSNGARWPGDSLLSQEQRAGCNCSMTIDVQGSF